MDKKGWEEENRLDAQSEQVLFLSNFFQIPKPINDCFFCGS